MVIEQICTKRGLLDWAAFTDSPWANTPVGKLITKLEAINTGPLAGYSVSVDFVTNENGVTMVNSCLFGVDNSLYLSGVATVEEVRHAIDQHLLQCRRTAMDAIQTANERISNLDAERVRLKSCR